MTSAAGAAGRRERPGPGVEPGELPAFDEAVLDVVDGVAAGRVTTYGDVAAALTSAGMTVGPRRVGRAMALHGGAVAWWRVVRADGSAASQVAAVAARYWREEGTPLLGPGSAPAARSRRGGPSAGLRVDLGRARAEVRAPEWVGR